MDLRTITLEGTYPSPRELFRRIVHVGTLCATFLALNLFGCADSAQRSEKPAPTIEKSAAGKPYERRAPMLPGAVTTADLRRIKSEMPGAPLGFTPSGPASGSGLNALSPQARKGSAPISIPVTSAPTRGWAILLYTSAGDPQKALMALDRVQTRAGIAGAYIEVQKEAHMVLLGSFDQPSSEDAQAELRRIRSLEIDGSRPFAQASLVPPPESLVVGRMPEHNLVLAKRAVGKEAVYTLQVGVYERGDGKAPTEQDLAQIRQAAEDAVAALRKEGDEAYYFHGRTRSMITIGLFGTRDYDERNPGTGDAPALAYARAKHPNNLVNGQGVRERIGANAKPRLQPSMVVAIPEE